MSTLKQVENAMSGEQAKAPIDLVDANIDVIQEEEADTSEVQEAPKFVIFKLADSNRQGGVHIPGIDYVIDPRTVTSEKPHGNGPEMIRLVAGVPTIWAKEQKDIDKDYIKKNTRFISFPRGARFISVPAWDITQIEWMRVARHNTKKPNRTRGTKTEYYEYDPNEQAKAMLDKEMMELEAIGIASKQPIEKIKPHAFYLRINFNDEYGIPKPEKRLRTEYMLAAKRDPKTFMGTIDTEEVGLQYKIRQLIIDGKIDIGRGDGYAYWSGGSRICLLPKSEKPMKTLTELAVTKNKEGRQFKEQVNKSIT